MENAHHYETVPCAPEDLEKMQQVTDIYNTKNPLRPITVEQVAAIVLHKGLEMTVEGKV